MFRGAEFAPLPGFFRREPGSAITSAAESAFWFLFCVACVLATAAPLRMAGIFTAPFVVYAGQKPDFIKRFSEMLAMELPPTPPTFVLVLLAFLRGPAGLGWTRKAEAGLLSCALCVFAAGMGFRSIKDTWILAVVLRSR